MKPFDVNDIRVNVSPDNLAYVMEDPDPMYVDWAFYNWGNTENPPELEPVKATLSLNVQDKSVYMTVAAVDEGGNDCDIPPGAHAWAVQQVKESVDGLLQYEGVTLTETLEKLLKGE